MKDVLVIFGPKREEVAGGWRGIYNQELHNLYAGHVVRMKAIINTDSILVGNPEGKRPLRRSRHRWEDNIRMNRREIGWEVVDWMRLADKRDQWLGLMNIIMNL
jgi:hypothetical protein